MKTKLMWQGGQKAIKAEYPGEFPEFESDTRSMMLMTFDMYEDMRKHLTDLKICLVKK